MKTGKPFYWEGPRKKRNPKPPANKWARWRKKMREQGRCVRCGQPSAPYEKCYQHRMSAQISHALSTLVKSGDVERVGRGLYQISMTKQKAAE